MLTHEYPFSAQCDTSEIKAKQEDETFNFEFDMLEVTIVCIEDHEYISQSAAELTCQTNGVWNIVGPENPHGSIGDCVRK